MPFDIAHDLFEGVIPEVLGEVLKDCMTHGYFTLEYLNDRLSNFPYDGADRTNKPSQRFKTIQGFKVKATAAQAWCLCRLIPLMVGHCVPADSEAWSVLLKLLDVVEYSTTAEATREHVVILADIIEEFLTAYYACFPEMTMKPKFHYIVHYPEVLAEFGPLVHIWTLRFEGKHNYFKELSRLTKKKKNVCKTLARRHELLQSSYRASPNLLQRIVLPLAGPNESVYKVGSININGTWYATTGLAVIVGILDDEYAYQFAEIMKCFIIGGRPYFLCRYSQESEYITHVLSYSVRFGGHLFLVNQSDLHDYYPLPIYKAGQMNFISMKHFVPMS